MRSLAIHLPAPRCVQHFSQDWRGNHLHTLTIIISQIGSEETGTRTKVYCDRDTNDCPTGIKISKPEIEALDFRCADFDGDRNFNLRSTPENVAVIS